MRTVRVLLFMLFIFAFSAPVFAAITVEKPNLPNYKGWPHQYSSVCYTYKNGETVTISLFAWVDTALQTAEFVIVFTAVDNWYVHVVGAKDAAILYSVYRPYPDNSKGKEKWTKFDAMDRGDEEKAKIVVDSINSFMKSRCPKVDQEIDRFFDELLEILQNGKVQP